MKTLFLLSSISFFLVFCVSGGSSELLRYDNNTDVYLNAEQLIRKYGYPSESHTVKTADGYLITMHRIPNVRHKGTKYPILILPCIYCKSTDFMILQKNSLAFVLADGGYDVWLANVRGNTNGRAHVELFPNQKAFWNFSWHESGIYDIPAQIDFVLNYTKQEKVYLVGYSMGTTMTLVLTSTLPEYNKKIEASFHLAVMAFLRNSRAPLFKTLSTFSHTVNTLSNLFAKGEFLRDNDAFKKFARVFCLSSFLKTKLCWNIAYTLGGCDPGQYNQTDLSLFIAHYPNGYSYKGFQHYIQSHKSGMFRQFDYGKRKNLLYYGSPTPPDYNLSAITSPMYFFQGKGDDFSTLEDVLFLADFLPTLRKLHVVDYEYYNHFDFIISQRSKELVYDLILQELNLLSDIKR